LFAAAVNETVPVPRPGPPAVMVIHEAAGVALHVQVGPAVTAIVPLPPAAAIACVTGSTVNVHGAGVGLGAGSGSGVGAGGGDGFGAG
jgi:hypothetical protein